LLAANGRALLADDMGLGKTLQAIAAAHWLVEREGVRRVLVVCPASLKQQWAREIRRFTDHRVEVADGSTPKRVAIHAGPATFVIANHELVLGDHSALVQRHPPDLIVLDEAQRIKNWRTRTAAVLKSVPSRFAFVLTGTPLESRLTDLYSLMQLVDARVLGPLWRFELEFHVTDERGHVIGYRNLGELRRRLAPVLLRRDRQLVKDQLPDRTEVRLDLALTQRQRELHDAAVQSAAQIAAVMARRPLTPVEENKLMAALQMARMACDAADLVDRQTVGSPKLDELGRLVECLCKDEGRKVVVFSQWERMTAMAEGVCLGLGIGCVRLHGGVPSKARQGLVDRFAEDPAVQVFLSTDAGATGLNLQCASAMVVLNLPWNPAVLDQRIGRIHRLGQRDYVLVVLLVAQASYEERVADLIAGKRNLFRAAVEPDATDDVVGVSKRTLEMALEALDVTTREAGKTERDAAALAAEQLLDLEVDPGDVAVPEPVPVPESMPEPEPEPVVESRADPVLAAIDALGRRLGGLLERVLVARGGVVAVVEGLEADALSQGEAIGAEFAIEVEVLDQRTWTALQKMGDGSPVAGADLRWQKTAPEPAAAPVESPLKVQARRKLAAANVLLQSNCGVEAVALLAESLRLWLAARQERPSAPEVGHVPAWLYGDLVPAGLATHDEAGLVLRAHGLLAATEVPLGLAQAVAAEVAGVVG